LEFSYSKIVKRDNEILKIREKFMDCKGVLKNVFTCPDKLEPQPKG